MNYEHMRQYLPITDAVYDQPDDRDFLHEEVFGSYAEGILPAKVQLSNTLAQDQNLPNNPSTRYACVFYTMTHITNEQNFIEWRDNPHYADIKEFQEESAFIQSKKAYERGLLNLNSGAFIQSGPKLAKILGLSSGYTLTPTVQSMKQALYENKLIQIGTNRINWEKTWQNDMVIVPGECYGHSMAIEGYDDLHGGCFIIRNSIGEFGKYRGRLFLKYDDIEILFRSKYAYIDQRDSEIMEQFKAVTKIQRALNSGFISNTRMEEYASRLEASYVIKRIVPGSRDFWNGANGNGRCSRQEFVWMFQKATGRIFTFDLSNPKHYILRREMAILATTMHDFLSKKSLCAYIKK